MSVQSDFIYPQMDYFVQQYGVDLSKKTITPTQAINMLCATFNGFHDTGVITDAGGFDAGSCWSVIVGWFGDHGYADLYAVFDAINAGGGWDTWPVDSAP